MSEPQISTVSAKFIGSFKLDLLVKDELLKVLR